MSAIREFARAKINLTLDIAGRRGDGFHEIASLVAFADMGDAVTLEPAGPRRLDVTGPFAADLAGENILTRALSLLAAEAPELAPGAVHLDKQLPVASGIGGGSADAGALLRAVRRAGGPAADRVDWTGIARRLGADVVACFRSHPAWMTGIGDRLADVEGGVPALQAVLVNPLAPVPADKTAQVYRALGASPLDAAYAASPGPVFKDRAALLDFMRARGNVLTRAALAVVPEAGVALAVLSAQAGVEYVALSGGGPTCFGVFANAAAAAAARDRVIASRPDWWAVAVTLG